MILKIGMIGTNFISDDFCEAATQVPGAELFAIYSRRQETGDAFAAKHGIPRVYTDYNEFLASGLDAVYVASPNSAHCSQTLKALNRKKHVLCEKVMAVNEQEVRSMIDCARQNNVVLLEAMRPDFDPAYDLIEQTLPRIGKLLPGRSRPECIQSGARERSCHGYRRLLYPLPGTTFRNTQKHQSNLNKIAKRFRWERYRSHGI